VSNDPFPFHDHLDACELCRNHPFAICTDGERILRSFAAVDWKPPVEQPLRGVESTHKKNGHALHVTAQQARLAAQRATRMNDPDRDVVLAFIDRAERIESIASEIVEAEKNGSQAAETMADDTIRMSAVVADAWDRLGLGDCRQTMSVVEMAALVLVLRELDDRAEWFPHGKSASIQHIEEQLTRWAKTTAAEIHAQRKDPTDAPR